MKSLQILLFSIIGGLIVSEIIRQYEPWIGYFIYSAIFLAVCINGYIFWRNRISFKITRQDLISSPPSISFTATNMSNYRNSLDEEVILKWLNIPLSKTFPCGEKHKDILIIGDKDKSLDPHETKEFKATIKKNIEHLYFSNFRQYRFTPNRGMYTYLRFASPNGGIVSFLPFYFKKILYRFFKVGLIYNPDKTT